MTESQLTLDNGPAAPRRYEAMLGERIHLGRVLGDALSHLAELTPEAVDVFRRLLAIDAELARFQRYDRDLFDVVLPAEDARLHQPPDVPSDHDRAPCSHCLRAALTLGPNVVLPPQARRVVAAGPVRVSAVKVTSRGVRVDRGFEIQSIAVRTAATEALNRRQSVDDWLTELVSASAAVDITATSRASRSGDA